MSWFKKPGLRQDIKTTSSPNHQVMPPHKSVAKMVARPRSGTDPDTCLEVFRSHWLQAVTIMNKTNSATPGLKRNGQQEEVDTVTHHIDQMMLLLVEEQGEGSGQGPILQFLLAEDIMEKVLTWSARTGEHVDKLRLHHIKTYDMLISQAQQSLLVHKPIIRPLLKLLSACAEHRNKVIEKHLILLLHQLCVCVTQNTQLLELLFNASSDQGPAKFLMFSLLIPYVHREGSIGQQARDALLLIMALSARHESIGSYIADNSDFCPVLATGLSGLYSSLPRKLNIPADDWYQLTDEDVNSMPDVIMFLNSLEFCNAVVQVAHLFVRDQLLTFIFNGFLVPVIGPALHQDILKLPISLVESYFGNSMEEVIAATAYLELFIRRITEPALMRTFLRFILLERHDDINILDSLITRISSNSRLCMVSLSLFRTLVDLDCEDVMFQLVFKYLIPCTHVMVSQRRSVKDLDLYSKTAEKFLSLTPACCMPDLSDTPPEGGATPVVADLASSSSSRSSSPDVTSAGALPRGALGGKLEHYETNYMEYLEAAHEKIYQCSQCCQCWTEPYNGENPSPDSLLPQDGTPTDDSVITGMDTEPSSTAVTPSASKTIESVFDEAHRQLNADLGVVPDVTPPPGDTHPKPLLQAPSCDGSESRGKPEVVSQEVKGHISGMSEERGTNVDVSASTDSGCGNSVVDQSIAKSTDESHSAMEDSRLLPLQQENCADSVTSEADSALSGSSSNTEHTHSAVDNPASRSDSPLNDNFDTMDFNAFLTSLKRVKTPVEFCDSIEESMSEIDALISEIKRANPRTKSISAMPQLEQFPKFIDSSEEGNKLVEKPELLSQPINTSTPNPSRPEPPKDIVAPLRSRSWTDRSRSSTDRLSDISLEDTIGSGDDESASRRRSGRPASSSVSLKIGQVPPLTATKYNLGTPNIGPFLSTLLSKLETMMSNTLYVNLLLTGLIGRLAGYSQPLLRSFLLNHSLVFQPTVKSLVQVLGSVKHKVDCYSYTVKDFEALLLRARRFLSWREEQYLHHHDDRGRPRSVTDVNTLTPAHTRTRGGSVAEPPKAERKKSSMFGDLLFRRSPLGNKKPTGTRDPRLQMIGDGKGMRFINRSLNETSNSDKMESVKTKNAVYCALVLEEFLKELAAISQEHAVISLEEVSKTQVS